MSDSLFRKAPLAFGFFLLLLGAVTHEDRWTYCGLGALWGGAVTYWVVARESR